jgi:glucose-1-phosphate thymidylyltransferase
LGQRFAWLDTGTHDILLEAASGISTLQKRPDFQVACTDEITHLNCWINSDQLATLAEPFKKNSYGQYLLSLLK